MKALFGREIKVNPAGFDDFLRGPMFGGEQLSDTRLAKIAVSGSARMTLDKALTYKGVTSIRDPVPMTKPTPLCALSGSRNQKPPLIAAV